MGKKGRAAYRAAQTNDACRVNNCIPLITDTTELITPEIAEKMLRKNKANRPINWNKVEEYRRLMEAGKWEFHSQGIILDEKGNVLTGQKRLWAIVYSGCPQYMRVSKGTPSNRAHLIDRGTSQSSRDLAARITERKHSPTEASIVRAILAGEGNIRPSADDIAEYMVNYAHLTQTAIKETKNIKKTKSLLMILAAICHLAYRGNIHDPFFFGLSEGLSDSLEAELHPIKIEKCWNKGAAFTLAMEKAIKICKEVTP